MYIIVITLNRDFFEFTLEVVIPAERYDRRFFTSSANFTTGPSRNTRSTGALALSIARQRSTSPMVPRPSSLKHDNVTSATLPRLELTSTFKDKSASTGRAGATKSQPDQIEG